MYVVWFRILAAWLLFGAVTARAAEPRTIVFFGDSLTAGYGLADPATEAYPARIQEKIDQAGLAWRTVNAGLSGETQEVADAAFGPMFGDTLHATLTGWRGGRRVEFRKAYLGLGPQHGYHGPIRYAGTLSADGGEIEGPWEILGWSGRFLMVRAGRKIAEAARKTLATV